MNSDSEGDIFSYTPLKREKVGDRSTVQSSQIKKKVVNNGKRLTQSSQSRNLRATIIQKPPQRKKSSSKFSSHYSSIPRVPPFEKENRSTSTNDNCSNDTRKSHVDSHLASSSQIKNHRIGNREKNAKWFSSNLEKNSDSSDSQATEIFSMNSDEVVPDIDFTQIYKTSSERNRYSSKRAVGSGGRGSDKASQSLLDNGPVSESFSQTQNQSALSDFKRQNGLQSKGKVTSKKQKILKTSPKKSNPTYMQDHSSGDEFEAPDQEGNVSKVGNWLEKSLEFLTPKKVEISEKTDIEVNELHCSKVCEERINSSTNNHEKKASHETCIHLHFHVDSPKKLIQPTLEFFFGNKDVSKKRCQEGQQKQHQNIAAGGSNSDTVLKSWDSILTVMRDCTSTANTSKSFIQNNGSRNTGDLSAKRVCPFYKYIEDTHFVVDAFSYGVISGVSAYFLSHFHYDHYRGLDKYFSKNVYCSQITANLIRLKIRIPEERIKPVPMEEPFVINGVEVTLYDANHCPGAVMFLFKLPTGKTILHVGDFRAHSDMETISDLWNRRLDVLYLDTTYLDPRYDFPSQEEILEKCVRIARFHVEISEEVLFVIGSYMIGKEKVFKAIAKELDCKIYAPTHKANILLSLEDQEIAQRLTKDKLKAQVHVVTMAELTTFKLKAYNDSLLPHFKVLVAIKPTGWTHSNLTREDLENIRPQQLGSVYLYGVPYSEHSSFLELERFVQFVHAKKIIPTVNNETAASRKKMESILNKWQKEAALNFKRRNFSESQINRLDKKK